MSGQPLTGAQGGIGGFLNSPGGQLLQNPQGGLGQLGGRLTTSGLQKLGVRPGVANVSGQAVNQVLGGGGQGPMPGTEGQQMIGKLIGKGLGGGGLVQPAGPMNVPPAMRRNPPSQFISLLNRMGGY